MPAALLVALVIGALLLGGGVTVGVDRSAADRGEGRAMPARTVEDALREYTDALMAIPGVVGVAQGLLGGRACIRVFVVTDTAELRQRIPSALYGYPVVVESSGEIRALPKGR